MKLSFSLFLNVIVYMLLLLMANISIAQTSSYSKIIVNSGNTIFFNKKIKKIETNVKIRKKILNDTTLYLYPVQYKYKVVRLFVTYLDSKLDTIDYLVSSMPEIDFNINIDTLSHKTILSIHINLKNKPEYKQIEDYLNFKVRTIMYYDLPNKNKVFVKTKFKKMTSKGTDIFIDNKYYLVNLEIHITTFTFYNKSKALQSKMFLFNLVK